jgi:hypothetical protein
MLNVQGLVIRKIYNGPTTGGKTHGFELERNNLASGIYFIRLTTSETHQVKKVIIN